MDLFDYSAKQQSETNRPLADRMRPKALSEFVGQNHVVGEGTLIRNALVSGRIFSMIFWGPPGCGKTTLARILAQESQYHFISFSAVLSGVGQIRTVIEEARHQRRFHRNRTLLFVDEIHRFNKAQQDAFLHHVESGLITLIGATTENPSFEVIPALISRCRVVKLNRLGNSDLAAILERALADRNQGLGGVPLSVAPEALRHMVDIANGDARCALNGLEAVCAVATAAQRPEQRNKPAAITLPMAEAALERKALEYDKSGDAHFNHISALHKSLRGSDPDAAVYWLVRMLDAGEDPYYILRRMVRFASEDVGIADPAALGIVLNAVDAYKFLGHPEGELAIVEAAVYLATAPKSNSIYSAYRTVQQTVAQTGTLAVPLHIRNAPTRLMKDMGYGKGYKYAHDYKDGFVPQAYLPEQLTGRRFYFPTDRGFEKSVNARLNRWRGLKPSVKNDSV